MTINEDNNVTEPKGVSRRTLVKGAAWAVPTIALASATPAFAASAVVPKPGDHCYQGGQSVNAFRFYTLQPTKVGDTFTLSGPALLDSSTVTGVGITITLVSTSGAAPNITRTYSVTAVDSSVTYPYLLLAGMNTTGGSRTLTVSQTQAGSTQSWTKEFVSNTTNCSIYDRK